MNISYTVERYLSGADAHRSERLYTRLTEELGGLGTSVLVSQTRVTSDGQDRLVRATHEIVGPSEAILPEPSVDNSHHSYDGTHQLLVTQGYDSEEATIHIRAVYDIVGAVNGCGVVSIGITDLMPGGSEISEWDHAYIFDSLNPTLTAASGY